MKLLSSYRRDKAYHKLQLRLRNVDKVYELVKDYEVIKRLKADAWRDYWNEVTEFSRSSQAGRLFGRSANKSNS